MTGPQRSVLEIVASRYRSLFLCAMCFHLCWFSNEAHHGRRVVECVPEVVAGGRLGDVGRHVHREGEGLLDLALPVVYPDDGGDPQVPDRHDVCHTIDAKRPGIPVTTITDNPKARLLTLSN